jgi:hypothetical protein
MKIELQLTETEADTLKILIASELKDANDRLAHASAHACEFLDPHHAPIQRIWDKLNA